MVYSGIMLVYIIADDDVRNPVVANTVSMLMLTEIVFLSTPDPRLLLRATIKINNSREVSFLIFC